jgi:hypothetical protein
MASNQNSSWLDKVKTGISIIVGLSAVCLIIYNIYSGVRLKKVGIPGIVEFEFGEKAEATGLHDWYGFFGDWDDNRSTYVTREVITLNFENDRRVTGVTKGLVIEADKEVSKTWEFQGFYTADYLVLTYLTKEPIPRGIGSYFLQRSGGDEYVGVLIARDCKNKVILKCPYALSKNDMNVERARERWPVLFGRQCDVLDLDPSGMIPQCQQE